MRKIAFFLILLSLMISTASAATLNVGPKETYKTIQDAVDAAADGDTINVASGTYPEFVKSTKILKIVGQKSKYPTVYGFSPSAHNYLLDIGLCIEGFTITKNGVSLSDGSYMTIKNNKFKNCGLYVSGETCSDNIIMNNEFSNGGIFLYQTYNNAITGNTIDKANVGLVLKGGATCTKISGNKFKNCKIGVQVPFIPSYLIGNIYKNNKVNIKIA